MLKPFITSDPTKPEHRGSATDAVRERVHGAVRECATPGELIERLAETIVAESSPQWLLLYRRGDDGGTPQLATLVSSEPLDPVRQLLLIACCERVCRDGDARRLDAPCDDPDTTAVVAPVRNVGRITQALVAVVDNDVVVETQVVLRAAADELTAWNIRADGLVHKQNAQHTAALVELLERVSGCEVPSKASNLLAAELREYLNVNTVAVGLCDEDGAVCRLVGCSTTRESVDPQTQEALESAMAETIVRDRTSVWPAPGDAGRHGLLTFKRLAAETGVASVVGAPLSDVNGACRGAWLFTGDDAFGRDADRRRFIEAAGSPASACLDLIRRAAPGRFDRLAASVAFIVSGAKGRAIAAVACLLALVLLIPVPYRVKCRCELQPVERRFVAAPFDSSLERSEVEPGDVVSTGQLLAVVDGREVRWELAGLTAEHSKAAKERDGFLESHDYGSAGLSRLQMKRLENRRSLLEERSRLLEIRSPIDGVVISGDLKKSEGVPVSMGDNLFEIAPLEEMLVEVGVPASEIPHVEPGRSVDVVLEAWPGEVRTGVLKSVHPRAEIRENEHVFIGEVLLKNPDGRLRPGMRGRAKINGPRRMLGWNLFHKPWNALRFKLGW